jgi:hypothetical protein
MLLIFGFLLCAVLWAFFHYRPRGVDKRSLAVYNIVSIIVAVPIAIAVAYWIYAGAADMPEKQKLAAYLALMAGGTAYLIVVSFAGLVRNFFVFPLAKRAGAPEDHRVV